MFKIQDRQMGGVESFEYLPITEDETYSLCEALKLSGGKATKAGATDVPTYICMGPGDGNRVPAIPVHKTTRFEVDYQAKPTAGTKVTLHTDGLQITATATSGVFEVVSVDEATQTATGYFR